MVRSGLGQWRYRSGFPQWRYAEVAKAISVGKDGKRVWMQREPTAVTRTLQMLSLAVAMAGAFFSPAVAVKRVTPKEILDRGVDPALQTMIAITESMQNKNPHECEYA